MPSDDMLRARFKVSCLRRRRGFHCCWLTGLCHSLCATREFDCAPYTRGSYWMLHDIGSLNSLSINCFWKVREGESHLGNGHDDSETSALKTPDFCHSGREVYEHGMLCTWSIPPSSFLPNVLPDERLLETLCWRGRLGEGTTTLFHVVRFPQLTLCSS